LKFAEFASPHLKVISDLLYEEDLLNLRIQAPICSDTGGNDLLTPASAQKGHPSPILQNSITALHHPNQTRANSCLAVNRDLLANLAHHHYASNLAIKF
jgi:hypothetical protein